MTKTTFKKLILDELKQNGHQNIISKIDSIKKHSYAGGSALDIHTTDLFGTEKQILEKIVKKYEMGSFDGMQDIYEYTNCRDDIPQVKYVFVKNEISQIVLEKIKNYIKTEFGISNDQESFAKRGMWLDQLIWTVRNRLQGNESFLSN